MAIKGPTPQAEFVTILRGLADKIEMGMFEVDSLSMICDPVEVPSMDSWRTFAPGPVTRMEVTYSVKEKG